MIDFNAIKQGLFRYEEPKGGWVVTIKTPAHLLKGAEKVRDAGIKNFDCFTPFPIHGIEKAMGLSRSWVPFFTLIGGLTGMTFAISSMSYVDLIEWPSVFGGKPHWSWPAYIPITFELTILFAAFCTLGSVIYLGRLGKVNRKPVVNSVTSDGFAIWIGDDISQQDVKNILGDLAVEIQKTPESKI